MPFMAHDTTQGKASIEVSLGCLTRTRYHCSRTEVRYILRTYNATYVNLTDNYCIY